MNPQGWAKTGADDPWSGSGSSRASSQAHYSMNRERQISQQYELSMQSNYPTIPQGSHSHSSQHVGHVHHQPLQTHTHAAAYQRSQTQHQHEIERAMAMRQGQSSQLPSYHPSGTSGSSYERPGGSALYERGRPTVQQQSSQQSTQARGVNSNLRQPSPVTQDHSSSNSAIGNLSRGLSGLAVNAPEFVPGGSNSMGGPVEQSDLKAEAPAFVPGMGSGSAGNNKGTDSFPATREVAPDAPKKMVQVHKDGAFFAVPEAEAEAEGYEIIPEEEGFEWAGTGGCFMAPEKSTLRSSALPDPIWDVLQKQSLTLMKQLPPDDERLKEIPSRFYSIFPLDNPNKRRGAGGSFGYPSSTYKVVSSTDGLCYCLKRFENVRTSPNIVAEAADAWSRMRPHPGVVRPVESFVQYGAVFFVSEYHACAETLEEAYITNHGALLSEATVWAYACQLISAVRAVHDAGLACRNLQASRILKCAGNKLRIGSVGIMDVLEYEGLRGVQEAKEEDMSALGVLLLSIACRNPVTKANLPDSFYFAKSNYSIDLMGLFYRLVTKPPTVVEACNFLSLKMVDLMDTQSSAVDALHSYLHREYDNGRVLRLLLKLGAINERPEHERNDRWSETGDRYVLKLFRDYCFHQVDESGTPVVDFGHAMQCLNKLDVGDPERILLMSRDEKSIIVVSFQDVKRCLEEAFVELCSESAEKNPHQRRRLPDSR